MGRNCLIATPTPPGMVVGMLVSGFKNVRTEYSNGRSSFFVNDDAGGFNIYHTAREKDNLVQLWEDDFLECLLYLEPEDVETYLNYDLHVYYVGVIRGTEPINRFFMRLECYAVEVDTPILILDAKVKSLLANDPTLDWFAWYHSWYGSPEVKAKYYSD